MTYFQANLDESLVTDFAGGPGTGSAATGFATFKLTEFDDPTMSPTLEYSITFSGLDLIFDGSDPNIADNITALHIHDLEFLPDGSPNLDGGTKGTLHTFNIWGLPRAGGDDLDDVMTDAATDTISGVWEDTDATPFFPIPTLPLSDYIQKLKNGELFLIAHSNQNINGDIGGFITPVATTVPEPGSLLVWTLALLLGGVLGVRRRRDRS